MRCRPDPPCTGQIGDRPSRLLLPLSANLCRRSTAARRYTTSPSLFADGMSFCGAVGRVWEGLRERFVSPLLPHTNREELAEQSVGTGDTQLSSIGLLSSSIIWLLYMTSSESTILTHSHSSRPLSGAQDRKRSINRFMATTPEPNLSLSLVK